MMAKTTASPSTGRHCRAVMDRSLGRPTASSTAPAIHCRIATTPTGPITGNANAATDAPTWLDNPLPNIISTPTNRPDRFAESLTTCRACGRWMTGDGVGVVVMDRECAGARHAQNASGVASIRWSYGCRAQAVAVLGRDRGQRDLHRCRDRARRLTGRG